jgi:hypothetical protein
MQKILQRSWATVTTTPKWKCDKCHNSSIPKRALLSVDVVFTTTVVGLRQMSEANLNRKSFLISVCYILFPEPFVWGIVWGKDLEIMRLNAIYIGLSYTAN